MGCEDCKALGDPSQHSGEFCPIYCNGVIYAHSRSRVEFETALAQSGLKANTQPLAFWRARAARPRWDR